MKEELFKDIDDLWTLILLMLITDDSKSLIIDITIGDDKNV